MKDFFTLVKQIIRASSTKVKILAGTGAALGLLSVSMIAFAGWSPNRTVYDWNNTADRNGSMDGPRMNAFINTPNYGDERAFFDARRTDQTTGGDVYKDVLDNVTDGSREVVLRSYIHNGANQTTNASGTGVAQNAKVRIDLPGGTDKTLRTRSYISISNPAAGYPAEVTDTTELIDDVPFSISYVPGSAKIYTAALNGASLSDSIVTDGALIGYDAINGNIPGCFEYQAIVEIHVKINAPQSTLKKFVKKVGQDGWIETVSVNPGDKVAWLIDYKNTGSADANDVSVGDKLPKHLSVVPGSVKWIYTAASDGSTQTITQSDSDIFNGVVNFGKWSPNGGFFLRFETTALSDFEGCEVSLNNIAFVRSREKPSDTQDNAQVKITKPNCVPTTTTKPPKGKQLPNTGPGEVAGLFAAVSAIGSVAYRVRLARKLQ